MAPDVYDWPVSVFESEPGFVPTVERPLVYHVFGQLDVPESLVITEDDYDDFLVGITENRALIPPPCSGRSPTPRCSCSASASRSEMYGCCYGRS